MSNPLRGVYIANRYYAYLEDSYKRSRSIKNSATNTQTARSFSVLGLAPASHTVSIALHSTYNVYWGSSLVGTTTWLGLSRLADLETIIGGLGRSMPISFVTPYGQTRLVVPTGSLDYDVFNPSNPGASSGMEFNVTLTLEEET